MGLVILMACVILGYHMIQGRSRTTKVVVSFFSALLFFTVLVGLNTMFIETFEPLFGRSQDTAEVEFETDPNR